MIAEISAAVAAARSISDVVGGLADLSPKHDEAIIKLQQLAIDLQGKIYNVQSQFQELTDAKREAEEKLAAMLAWEAEATRYELKPIVEGMFVYSLKPAAANGEPEHWLCPNCYGNRKKSVLTKTRVDNRKFSCPACDFAITPTQAPTVSSVPMNRSIRGGWG